MAFTQAEMVNMVYALGEADRNCLLACRLYRARYPEARQPRVETFIKLKRRFEATGSVVYPKNEVVNRRTTGEENELAVLLSLQETPHASLHEISTQHDISVTSVWRLTKKHHYHPYHIELHQQLHGNDFQSRINFCNNMTVKITQQPNFLKSVLFSDESTFNHNGLLNRHNCHYYSTENPHWTRQIDYQHQWSLNVWGGIIGDHVIGPYFFDGRLTGETYLNFLTQEMGNLLENVDLHTRQNMWFQQDGAPPHYFAPVRQYLNNWLPDRWIGRGGPLAWPPRSPDLTPMDFFLWGYVKDMVYRDEPTTSEDMKQRIRRAFESVSPRMLSEVRNNLSNRFVVCVEQEGRNFEQLLN